MGHMASYSSDDSDNWKNTNSRSRRVKRRKLTHRTKREVSLPVGELDPGPSPLSFGPLLDALGEYGGLQYEELMEELLPEYLRDRRLMYLQQCETDKVGRILRPPTYFEVVSRLNTETDTCPESRPIVQSLALRKLKLQKTRRLNNDPVNTEARVALCSVTPLPPTPRTLPVGAEIAEALYGIRTTPYENSFLSRNGGCIGAKASGLISVDWETTSPWMELMSDIRSHYTVLHPERDRPIEEFGVIEYTSLQQQHFSQIHDLLARVFWAGIDVSDSLQYNPERCTVVATYKRLVVGVAILSSPQETYITYLAVKAGWDNAQIATTMLHHLITLNPNKDITLHVSANNPAMILYNRFGFKAEEFVVGFYEDYLDPQSRASKNAFKLRLRR